MRYLLLIHHDESAPTTPAAVAATKQRYRALASELEDAGAYLGGAPLVPTSLAKTVRTVDGIKVTTDGPFAETREQLGGFFMVEAPSIDAALEIARRMPGSEYGSIEVRQVDGPDALAE